jgi:O-antigen chain-terminating methyltransferase
MNVPASHRYLQEHHHIDATPPPGSRLAPLKRFIARCLGYILHAQNEFNANVTATFDDLQQRHDVLTAGVQQLQQALQGLTHRQDDLVRSLESAHAEMSAAIQRQDDLVCGLEQIAADVRNVVRRHDDVIASLEHISARNTEITTRQDDMITSVAAVAARIEQAEQGFRALHEEVAQLAALNGKLHSIVAVALDGAGAADSPQAATAALRHCTELWNDSSYQAFENAQRGSHDEILARLQRYIEPITQLPTAPECYVLDVGCGRGEFLELLQVAGVPARGIDLNRAAIDIARQRQLPATHADLFMALRDTARESLAAITAFHVIEHLTVDGILMFLRLAVEKIMPGGLLVLETPNTLSLRVAASDFYKDPTHVRPVHPLTLEHWLKHAGFATVTVEFVHPFPADVALTPMPNEQAAAVRSNFEKLDNNVFGCRDVAVLARTPA